MAAQVRRIGRRPVRRLCSFCDHGTQVSEFGRRFPYGSALSTDLSTRVGDKSAGFDPDMWGVRGGRIESAQGFVESGPFRVLRRQSNRSEAGWKRVPALEIPARLLIEHAGALNLGSP